MGRTRRARCSARGPAVNFLTRIVERIRGDSKPGDPTIHRSDPPPPAMPAHVTAATLKGMLRGDVLADDRAGLSSEEIARKRRLPVEVVVATLARERTAVAHERAERAKREAEVEGEIRQRRRGRERNRMVW
jgi:hypothetical protein